MIIYITNDGKTLCKDCGWWAAWLGCVKEARYTDSEIICAGCSNMVKIEDGVVIITIGFNDALKLAEKLNWFSESLYQKLSKEIVNGINNHQKEKEPQCENQLAT